MSDDTQSSNEGLQLIKSVCRQIAQEPGCLAMIRATRDWPRVGVHVGAYVIFEERDVALNGCLVIVARLTGRDYHYVGHAERIIKHTGVSIRLDDGVMIPERAFAPRGPVVMIARQCDDMET